MAADLSVVVVNYRAGALVREAVASVEAQRFSVRGRPGAAEVMVVDNASGPGDEPLLAALGPGTRVIRNERNLGFATACNQGLGASKGEFVCFLNPDARRLPGAVENLLSALESDADIGAVGPALWLDDDQSVQWPPIDLFHPTQHLTHSLAIWMPRLAPLIAASWTRRAMVRWRATAPFEVSMISGACLLARRSTLETVGPFDPDFFLYYEDADWCRRARAKGFRLLCVPGAQGVHYHNQSAKTVAAEAFEWLRASEARYLAKHFGRFVAWLLPVIRRIAERHSRLSANAAIDLGSLSDPPLLSVSAPEPVAFEFSYHWLFVPAIVAFPASSAFRFLPPVWSRFLPTRFFAKAVSIRSGLPIATWTWIKQDGGPIGNQSLCEPGRSAGATDDFRAASAAGAAKIGEAGQSERHCTLRLYRPGDEAGILALFQEVFRKPRGLAHWHWKYRDNPAGPIFAAVAEGEGGRIVGHYATIPAWARVGGHPCQMVQVIDSMVAPDYRQALKKPGVFVRLALFFYESIYRMQAAEPEKSNTPALQWMPYGFPNDPHLRLGQRLIGYSPLAPVGSLAALTEELGRRLPRGWEAAAYEIRVTSGVDGSVDGLWRRCVDELPTATVRDQTYINWRYRDCPDQTYKILLAENHFTRELEGLAVLRVGWQDRPVVVIADWLVPGRAQGAAAALLRAAFETAVAEHCDEIVAWFPAHFAISIDLVTLGFRPVPTEYWLVVRPVGHPVPPEMARPTWYYTLGDSDLV